MTSIELSLPFKEELEVILQKHVSIFRDVLADLHQDERAFQHDPLTARHQPIEIVEKRLQLLEALEHSKASFEMAMQSLFDHQEHVDFEFQRNFIHTIEILRTHLADSDFELILLCEQLTRLFEEIHRATAEFLNVLESKSGESHPNNYHLQLAAPKRAQMAVGLSLLDPENETSNQELI